MTPFASTVLTLSKKACRILIDGMVQRVLRFVDLPGEGYTSSSVAASPPNGILTAQHRLLHALLSYRNGGSVEGAMQVL